jgi:hypothetical protein
MARGSSGRIVLEVDPPLKDRLYVELAREGKTLRSWFIEQAERYLERARQPLLFAAEPDAHPWKTGRREEP